MTRFVVGVTVLVCLLPAAPAAVVSPKAPPAPTAGKAKALKGPSRDASAATDAAAG